MARSRVIHPRLLDSHLIRDNGIVGGFVFLALILQADDAGRLRGEHETLSSCINPYKKRELSTRKLLAIITQLEKQNRITVYDTDDGCTYIEIVNWREYQRISHPTKSRIPAPFSPKISGNIPEPLRKHSGASPNGEERRGEERRGEDQEQGQKPSKSLQSQSSYRESPIPPSRPEKPVEKSGGERGLQPIGRAINGSASTHVGKGPPDPDWPRVSVGWRAAFEKYEPEYQQTAAAAFQKSHGAFPWEPKK